MTDTNTQETKLARFKQAKFLANRATNVPQVRHKVQVRTETKMRYKLKRAQQREKTGG